MTASALTPIDQPLYVPQSLVLLDKLLFKVSIPDRCFVKKNTARHFGKGRIAYSDNFMQWQYRARKHVAEAKDEFKIFEPINEYVFCQMSFYFDTHQWESDSSNLKEGPQDLLADMGVIKNDKLLNPNFDQRFYGRICKTDIEIWRVK